MPVPAVPTAATDSTGPTESAGSTDATDSPAGQAADVRAAGDRAGDPGLRRPATLNDVRGWFDTADHRMFCWLLDRQDELGIQGDLLEIGAYLGRSAVVLGGYLRAGETFTVCDLFESEATDSDNSAEMDLSYRESLTRRAFESNYLSFHDDLPRIHQGPSKELADARLIAPGSQRFIHIDASHLYEHVAADLRLAREALRPDGIVAMDDYRSEHTPGVAAATWEAVKLHGLRPVALTTLKFYGTWGDPEETREALIEQCRRLDPRAPDVQVVFDERFPRLWAGALPVRELPRSRWFAEEEARREAEQREHRLAELARRRRPSARARRLAVDLTPPLAARSLRRLRDRARSRDQA